MTHCSHQLLFASSNSMYKVTRIQAPELQNIWSEIYLEVYQSAIWPCIFFCSQCQLPKLHLVPAMPPCHPFCHFLASPVLPVELSGDMMRQCSVLWSAGIVQQQRNQPTHTTLCSHSHQQLGCFPPIKWWCPLKGNTLGFLLKGCTNWEHRQYLTHFIITMLLSL